MFWRTSGETTFFPLEIAFLWLTNHPAYHLIIPFLLSSRLGVNLSFKVKPSSLIRLSSQLQKGSHLSTRRIMARSLLPMQHNQFGRFHKRKCCKKVIFHPFHHALIECTKYVTHFDGLEKRQTVFSDKFVEIER